MNIVAQAAVFLSFQGTRIGYAATTSTDSSTNIGDDDFAVW